ncbi:VCBS repeat-containing protein [Galbibacter sp. EGI 63066]|uniref:VCBS repeat-containing protein n=1 Tax=Galbibacter sp. EGI 63066 TaxID=2993559 RepID=UPI002248FF42|nr:VCBS repeat-containing protein [Galbibacter sp. EGI 63066]MCX2679896.1 VCBS repeat-containing protein [Galbibacter sp. EGI 63066]
MNHKMNIQSFVIKTVLSLSLFCILFSCKKEDAQEEVKNEKETLFTLVSSEESGIDFINEIENQKDFNIFKYRNFYNGGGVAIGDINNDGLPDIYLTANMGQNKLFLNKGDFKFEDITESAGVGGNKPWSTGVTMVDINSDGLLDIYVANAGNMEGNNHDNDLYINNGDLTFTEKAAAYNLAKSGFTTHAAFFDYDKDGDLDAYILNNSNIPVSSLGYAEQRETRAQDWEGIPDVFKGVGDMLLRNDNGKFTDASEEAGIYGSLIGFGLGVMITDINEDNYPDIYVSNDFYERDYLYINQKDGTFNEEIKEWTSRLCLSAMGVDIADINNDGLNDIFITDMLPEGDERVKSVMEFEGYDVFKLKQSKDFYQQYIQNTLQLNNGNNGFSEVAYYSGVAKTDWSWAGLIFDMDNDGYRDIYVTNGINHDLTDIDFVNFFANEIIQKMALTGKKQAIDSIINKMPRKPIPNYAFKNNSALRFTNVADNWGLGTPSMSNGVAYGDLDNDGDLDLIVNNVNMESFVYKNNSEKLSDNNYIKLKFEGSEKNKFAIGTTVKLYMGEKTILQELIPYRGFQSTMEHIMTIGVGETKTIDSIKVIWPNDHTQKLTNVQVNQLIELKQSDAEEKYTIPVKQKVETYLTEVASGNIEAHQENDFVDFDYEGLISTMTSQEGPALSVADVNNDGNEDVFVGGAKGQAGVLYLNSGNGNLVKSQQTAFKNDQELEDTSSAFFDTDNDGDLDLMVGTGGNEESDANKYVTRLYLNNGHGKFTKSEGQIPSTFHNTSVIAPYDFDGDGDTDVFIGSRSVPGIYGVNPKHLFLENQGDGSFKDITESKAYDLKDAGMITDAIWADTDGDDKKDLVLVGDWAAPMILKNSGRRLGKLSSNLSEYGGWWNTVKTIDVDNDGDLDLVMGNMGENISYKASKDAPMRMFINDYDNNGTIEQIVTHTIDGKDKPIHMKKELTAQLSSLKKENLKASDYAKRSIQELFPKELTDNAIQKTVTTIQSVIAINNGNGQFDIKPLPGQVQFSCVCDITPQDINNDGNIDLIMGGNNYEFKPQFSRLDSNYGCVLLGDGTGDFNWQNYNKSGFFVRGEVKHIKPFKDKNGSTHLFVALNNDQPKIFKLKVGSKN